MKTISIVQIFSLAFFVCCIAPCASLNAAAASERKAKRFKIDTSSSLKIASEEIRIEDLAILLQSPFVDSEDFVKKLDNFLSISSNNLEMGTEFGTTLLHYAADNGHINIATLLLDKKAHIEAQTENNWTSLHVAAYKGHAEVVSFLLDNKAHIEAQNEDGQTPLFLAINNGCVDIVKLLIRHRAYTDSESKTGNTALSAILSNAIKGKSKEKEIFSLLLQAGADCNFYAKKKEVLLNLVICQRMHDTLGCSGESELEVIKELLQEGVNPELLEKFMTIDAVPLSLDSRQLALHRGDFEVVELIEAEMERRATEPKASVQLGSMVNMVYEECILDEQKILGERGLAEIIARYGQSSRNARLETYEKP